MLCPVCAEENADRARFCQACGTALKIDGAARESRRVVTILFCDVTGFTSLGERLDPESLSRVMARYFATMRTALERHGGTVEKFIGDAVMAVFGIPQLHEDDALRAVRAAMEMRSMLDVLNVELEQSHGVSIETRVGVHTGEVMAGALADAQILATGDALNVAARLEKAAAPSEILIGLETYRLTRDAVEVDELASLSLKGKSEKTPAFRLRAVHGGVPGHVRSFTSPLVGRDRPLRALRSAFEDALADQRCHLVTVLGVAGVGKSRLVEEFLSGVGDSSIFRGACLPYGEGMTFAPILDVVRQAADLGDFAPDDQIRSRTQALMEGDPQGDAVCDRIVQLAGATLDAPSDDTFWAVRRFVETLARRRPLVLVFDDLQWAESTFLDVIDHIAEWSRDVAILLVCMARPDLLELRPSWGGGKRNGVTLSLEPLSAEQSARLISNLLGVSSIAEALRERIAEAAEGNPLFVEEMVANLIDEGLLLWQGATWVATDGVEQVPVPPTIAALLAARIDRLHERERSVLEAASVVGQDFSSVAVRGITDGSENVSADVQALIGKDLVRRSSAGEDDFQFRHMLLRDVTYEGMPKGRRAAFHVRYADLLTTMAGDRIAEQEELIGYHLEKAFRYREQLGADASTDLARRAATHLSASGRRASMREDFPAASGLLRSAAALLPPADPQRLEILGDLGAVLNRAGAGAAAVPVLAEVVERARAAGDEQLEARARIDQYWSRGSLDIVVPDMRADVERLVPIFEARHDDLGLTKALQVLAVGCMADARYADEEALLHSALECARRVGDRLEESEIITELLDVAVFGPTPVANALKICEQIGQQASGRRLEAGALGARGVLVAMLGEFPEARRLVAGQRAILEDLGLEYLRDLTFYRDWQIEMLADDPEAAERAVLAVDRAIEGLEAAGGAGFRATLLSHALSAQGRYREALDLAERAVGPAGSWRRLEISSRTAKAKALSGLGAHQEAERLAKEAVTLGEGTDGANQRGDGLMDLAQVLRNTGQLSFAQEAARAALAFYEKKANRVSAEKARTAISAA